MILAESISFDYDGVPVLAGVDLAAPGGAVVGLIGPNGSGKTTLMRMIYGALAPRAGTVQVDDADVSTLSTRQVARRLSVVAQESPSELPLTVGEMVLLGRSPHRRGFESYGRADRDAASRALERVGLTALAGRDYRSLSGGEKQRVLIARTLAQGARYLLLDEPTNHLDVGYQHEVLGLVREIAETAVVVLHDLNLAARYCDSLVLLDQGRVVASGPVESVLLPAVLEPVYRVRVHRSYESGCLQLVFSPPTGAPVGRPVVGVVS